MECLKYIVKKNNKLYSLQLIPYIPFDNPTIDSYYLLSHKEYQNGSIRVDFNLKQALYDLGIVDIGKNTLAYNREYGSRFYISTREILCGEETSAKQVEKLCDNCGLCIRACPTGAISEDGFCREKCLREQMENGKYLDEKKAGTRVFGCDICQRVCHLNSKEYLPLPSFLSLDSLQVQVNENLGELKNLIGSNMARRKRFSYLLSVAIKNSKVKGGE